jgi:hypothetical protein
MENGQARYYITGWVIDALRDHGGKAEMLAVAKYVWQNHEAEIRKGGNLLYEWQYEIRWAAYFLRREGVMLPDGATPRGIWALSEKAKGY